MTASLPGIRPGQIWQTKQLVKGGQRERVEVTGLGLSDVYANVLGHDDTPTRHRSFARAQFEERYMLVSEPGVVTEDG